MDLLLLGRWHTGRRRPQPQARPACRQIHLPLKLRIHRMNPRLHPSRRHLLHVAGTMSATAALPKWALAAPASTDITEQLAKYMVSARDKELPPEVLLACKHRILDTLGAMVSGA